MKPRRTPSSPLTDEQLKIRALQRWENEGGFVPFPEPPARASERPTKSRARAVHT